VDGRAFTGTHDAQSHGERHAHPDTHADPRRDAYGERGAVHSHHSAAATRREQPMTELTCCGTPMTYREVFDIRVFTCVHRHHDRVYEKDDQRVSEADLDVQQQDAGPMTGELGYRLARLRLARGWSLKQADNASGVNHMVIHRTEHGMDPRLSDAARLAAAYGTTVDALLGEPPQ
jgi:hypothetical protein